MTETNNIPKYVEDVINEFSDQFASQHILLYHETTETFTIIKKFISGYPKDKFDSIVCTKGWKRFVKNDVCGDESKGDNDDFFEENEPRNHYLMKKVKRLNDEEYKALQESKHAKQRQLKSEVHELFKQTKWYSDEHDMDEDALRKVVDNRIELENQRVCGMKWHYTVSDCKYIENSSLPDYVVDNIEGLQIENLECYESPITYLLVISNEIDETFVYFDDELKTNGWNEIPAIYDNLKQSYGKVIPKLSLIEYY